MRLCHIQSQKKKSKGLLFIHVFVRSFIPFIKMIAIYSCVCSFVHSIYLFIYRSFIAFIYLCISFYFSFVRLLIQFIYSLIVSLFVHSIYLCMYLFLSCLFRNYVIISFNRQYTRQASLPHAHVYSVTIIGTRQLLWLSTAYQRQIKHGNKATGFQYLLRIKGKMTVI